jgi:hypothetical protein
MAIQFGKGFTCKASRGEMRNGLQQRICLRIASKAKEQIYENRKNIWNVGRRSAFTGKPCCGRYPCFYCQHPSCVESGTISRGYLPELGIRPFSKTAERMIPPLNPIILYPQAQKVQITNPRGCYDWWSYLSGTADTYATKQGPQMKAVLCHAETDCRKRSTTPRGR